MTSRMAIRSSTTLGWGEMPPTTTPSVDSVGAAMPNPPPPPNHADRGERHGSGSASETDRTVGEPVAEPHQSRYGDDPGQPTAEQLASRSGTRVLHDGSYLVADVDDRSGVGIDDEMGERKHAVRGRHLQQGGDVDVAVDHEATPPVAIPVNLGMGYGGPSDAGGHERRHGERGVMGRQALSNVGDVHIEQAVNRNLASTDPQGLGDERRLRGTRCTSTDRMPLLSSASGGAALGAKVHDAAKSRCGAARRWDLSPWESPPVSARVMLMSG